MRDPDESGLLRASGALGSFTFDSVGSQLDDSAFPGLFPGGAASLPTSTVLREDSTHAPMWRVASAEPLGTCPTSGGAFSFPPSAADVTAGPSTRDQPAAASAFTLHSSRRGARNSLGSASMPEIFAAGAPAPLARSSKSTWDMSMDSVFSEDEEAHFDSSDEDADEEPDHLMDETAQEDLDNFTSSPRVIRTSAAQQTPPRVSGSGFDPCCSPGEYGGLQYIQSPPNRAGKTATPLNTRQLHLVFLPRGTKILHLVRHGESTYNAACGAPGSSWEDPTIFDARLTDHGQRQAMAVGPKLAHVPDSALWVSSPLTRAIQTCMLARACRDGRMPAESWLTLRPELAEHLMTTGDVGRPRSVLQRDFPDAKGALDHLEENWWFHGATGDNCAMRGMLNSREPKKDFKARVGLFRKWVLSRPEAELVIFGHSTFFKELMGGDRRLANCEVFTFRL